MGRSTLEGEPVQREAHLSEVHRRPEGGDRARRSQGGPLGPRRLPRARHRRDPLLRPRDKLLEGGKTALNGKDERQAERELKKRIAELERALGRKTYELEIAGEALRAWE